MYELHRRLRALRCRSPELPQVLRRPEAGRSLQGALHGFGAGQRVSSGCKVAVLRDFETDSHPARSSSLARILLPSLQVLLARLFLGNPTKQIRKNQAHWAPTLRLRLESQGQDLLGPCFSGQVWTSLVVICGRAGASAGPT